MVSRSRANLKAMITHIAVFRRAVNAIFQNTTKNMSSINEFNKNFRISAM